jgi:hypothetical protein
MQLELIMIQQYAFRGIDGLTHRPKKQTPKGVYDRYGATAEAALIEYLEHLRGQGSSAAAQTLVIRRHAVRGRGSQ